VVPLVEPLDRDFVLREVLKALAENCVRLRETCYWAGASAMALEELHHRGSFDLDFHTKKALVDVRPILAEIQQAFPGRFELISVPDGFGSGFKGVLRLPEMEGVTVEVLSNFEDVPSSHLVRSTIAPKIWRITIQRFLADKIQCIAERSEARDLVDVAAVLRRHPQLSAEAKQILESQDALILAERLSAWSESSIREDLAPYRDVDPGDALRARDLLLDWLWEAGEM
jgi:hypothetical protein